MKSVFTASRNVLSRKGGVKRRSEIDDYPERNLLNSRMAEKNLRIFSGTSCRARGAQRICRCILREERERF